MKTMTQNRICNPLRVALRPLARAIALAAGLAVGSVQALTTSQTFDLGTSPASTNFPSTGIDSLLVWIAKGSLPTGSILRSVTATDLKLETQLGNSWASNLGVFLDPTPETPGGPGGILKIGEDNIYGGATNELVWGAAANNDGPVTISRSDADWAGPIDLSTVAVMLGNGYAANTAYSGTITVVYDVPQVAAIESFGPGAVVGELVGNAASIAWTVPSGTGVTALAPTFTLSSGTCDRDNGGPTTYDFTNPVVYTVTDGATVNTYTVTVTIANKVVWDVDGGGAWDTSTANWLPLPSGPVTTFANGNEVIFDKTAGGTITIAPGISPLSTTVNAASGTYAFSGQPIATGSLTKSGGGTLQLNVSPTNLSSIAVNGGTLFLFAAESGFSPNGVPFTIPNVTVESGATLKGWRARAAGGTLTLNGGRYWEDNGWNDGGWNGPVNLAADSFFGLNGTCYNQTIAGQISGPGGFTFSTTNGAVLTLTASNSYMGPTIVMGGTVKCDNVNALGGGALSISSGGAKVNLNYSGTRNIAGLTLGGVEQTSGTHGSVASGAAHPNDTYFTPGSTGTVTVPPSSSKNMLTFSFGALGAATIGDTTITLEVPFGTDRTALAPTYTVSPGATGSPVPGTALNFTGPQIYTVTAENLSTKQYTVTVSEAILPDIFTWANAVSGNWSIAANWTNEESIVAAPLAGGRQSYTLNFTTPGTYTATNNLSAGFQLNQLNLSAAVSLAGNGLAFVSNGPTLPTINQNSGSAVAIPNSLDLGANTTFGGSGGGQVTLTGLISGAGSLTKNGTGTLRIDNVNNSFVGGTIINSGTLRGDIDAKAGTGPITLNGGTLFMWRFKPTNALTVNGGAITSENGFNQNLLAGPVTLNTTLPVFAPFQLTFSNTISGVGGLTKTGGGLMILSNTCTSTYSGPTTVTAGTLRIDRTEAVSGSSALSISGTGKVNLNYVGTKTVTSLTLGGVEQNTPGTYGSVASGANVQLDTFFTTGSTGTVTIGGGSDYDTWLGEFTFALGADTTSTGDPDGDGMTNQEEYAFGLNPTLGSSANPIVAQLDRVTGNFQYTRRATPATTGLTYTVLTSTTLTGWASGGATETGFTTSGNIQTVTVNVTAPPVGGKLFVRVEALPTP